MRVIDETQGDIVHLMARDFGARPQAAFEDEFTNWLHYRARRVPALPRQVKVSNEVLRQQDQFPAIAQIRFALAAGRDVGSWLSDRVRVRKTDHRADMMFNDWQITHFHLGRFFQSPAKIRRSKPLLFVHVTAGEATLLDVRPHDAWTETRLLEILLRTNAPIMEKYELRSVTTAHFTDKQIGDLRASGGNTAISVSGRAFMLGGGIASSGHAMRLCQYQDWFFEMRDQLRSDFEADHIAPRLKPLIYGSIGVPVRLGAYYDHKGLALIDKSRRGLVLNQMVPLE